MNSPPSIGVAAEPSVDGIDPALAAALGWPHGKYAAVERERRWRCDALPPGCLPGSVLIEDLYVTGTQLRLRDAVPDDSRPPQRRLTRKADVGAAVRLLTSIYLSEAEFRLLSVLPGRRLRKRRHHWRAVDGAMVSIDVFEGALAGLVLAEVEFDSDAAMAAFASPAFAVHEVTADLRYTGGRLATDGLPPR